MDASVRVLNILIRAFGAGAVLLGAALWLGYGRSLTQLHIGLGVALVLSLWGMSWIAWMNSVRSGLAALGAVWGVVIWVFGLTQGAILPGALHWLVELAHLAAGVIAVVVGVQLATAVAHGRVSTSVS